VLGIYKYMSLGSVVLAKSNAKRGQFGNKIQSKRQQLKSNYYPANGPSDGSLLIYSNRKQQQRQATSGIQAPETSTPKLE
jgi:hypothetical protein